MESERNVFVYTGTGSAEKGTFLGFGVEAGTTKAIVRDNDTGGLSLQPLTNIYFNDSNLNEVDWKKKYDAKKKPA